MASAGDPHMGEIEDIIDCLRFLVDMKILVVTHAKKVRAQRRGSYQVVSVQALPQMHLKKYPSLGDLVINLMASISFFYAEADLAKKYGIYAKMAIAIGNHGKPTTLLPVDYRKLVSWLADFFSDEFCDDPSKTESDLERCNRNMALLRKLAETFGYPEVYVSTAVYNPAMPGSTIQDDTGACQSLLRVDGIAPLGPLPVVGESQKRKPLPDLLRWYVSKNLDAEDTKTAVAALIKRHRKLRKRGVLRYPTVATPAVPMHVGLENGGTVTVIESNPILFAYYYRLDAFLADVMYTLCMLFTARGEYDKRSVLAVLFDCLMRHWPAAADIQRTALWEEMATWLWKFARMDCLDLNDPGQTVTYLERCDKYLEEFQQRFVSKVSLPGPINVWGEMYLPPGTQWRKSLMDALNGRGRAPRNPLKSPEFDPFNFVRPASSAVEPNVGNSSTLLKKSTKPRAKKDSTGFATSSFEPSFSAGELHKEEGIGGRQAALVHGVGNSDDLEPPEVPPPPSLRAYMALASVTNSTLLGQRDKNCYVKRRACGGVQNDEEAHPRQVYQNKKLGKDNAESLREEKDSKTSVQQSPEDGRAPKQEAIVEHDVPMNIRIKPEPVEVIEVPSSSSDEDETETGGEAAVETNPGGRSRDIHHQDSSAQPFSNRGQKRLASNIVENQSNVGSSNADSDESRDNKKQQLDRQLGSDYRARMGGVQTLIKRFKDHFPDHSDRFDLLDEHMRNLREFAAPDELTEVVRKLLDERCLENINGLLEGFLTRFSSLLDPSVKEEMETCLDAVNLVLNDSRMLVKFQTQCKKKQRC